MPSDLQLHSHTSTGPDATLVSVLDQSTEKHNSDKPCWVFVHGWGANGHCWYPLVEHLQQQAPIDFKILELPGFGDNADAAATLEQTVQSVAQHVPQNSILVGWSLGAMLLPQVIRACATQDKDIEQVISIAANLSFVARENFPTAMQPEIFRQFNRGFKRDPLATWKKFTALQAQGDEQRRQLSKTLKQLHPAPAEQAIAQWQVSLDWLGELDNRQVWTSLTIPTLHIFGKADSLVPAEAATAIRHHLPAAHHKIICLPATAHAPHLALPEQTAELILRFIRGEYRDKRLVASSFDRAAKNYDRVAHLQKSLATQLCDWLPAGVETVADLGCGTGYCSQPLLSERASIQQLVGLDLAGRMLQTAAAKLATEKFAGVCADIETLPFADAAFDGLISGMSLQWCEDFPTVLREARRVLKNEGVFLFSTLGPQTLYELREAWSRADQLHGERTHVHVNNFLPLETIAPEATKQGFTVERAEAFNRILTYEQVIDLMRELKIIGAHNVNRGQSRGLTSRRRLLTMIEAYESFRGEDGLLPATYEVGFYLLRKSG